MAEIEKLKELLKKLCFIKLFYVSLKSLLSLGQTIELIQIFKADAAVQQAHTYVSEQRGRSKL